MKNGNRCKYYFLALTGIAVSAISLSALAQQPPAGGQQPPGGAPGGGPGGGGFGGRQRGGQGGGGFNARFTTGTIAGGDASAGTITITPQGGAGTQVIKVNQDTTIETQTTISIKDLKVGDEVQVQGIPTGISATTITAGTPPSFMPGARGRRGAPGATGAPGAPGGAAPTVDANGNPLPPQPPPANAMANGKVVSVNPLTISVGDNMDVVLKMGKDAKITRYDKLPYSKLKVGDTIIASGATDQNGMFTATGIGVNMQMGGGGPFGGGFGGGGGLFPGGGGFGGGRGGRRGGGGGAGGPGGGAAGGAGGGLPPGGN